MRLGGQRGVSPLSRLTIKTYLKENISIVQPVAAFLIKIVGAGLSFALSLLIAQKFGPTGVGQFGLAISTLIVGSTLSLVGLDYVLIRNVSGEVEVKNFDIAKGIVNKVLLLVLSVSSIFGLILCRFLVPWWNKSYGMATETVVLSAIGAAIVSFALMRVASSALRSSGGVLIAQALDGPAPMAIAIMGTVGLYLTIGMRSVVDVGWVYAAAMSACAVGGMLLYYFRTRDWPPATPTRSAALLRQGWPLAIAASTGFIVDWFILFSLAANEAAAQVGLLRMAAQISGLLSLVMVSFDAVSGPRIAAFHRNGDIAGIRRVWRQSAFTMLAMSLPVIVAISLAAEPVLSIFGPEFREGAWALRILLLGQLVNAATGPVGAILIMTGHDRWTLAYSVVSTVGAVVICLALMPTFGLLGAAAASALTICLRNGFAFAIAFRIFGNPFRRD